MTTTDSKLRNLKVFTWLRKLYDWCMDWAEHRYGPLALCVMSAIESIFFPIPVDPVLMAMGAAKPKRALYYAALTTAFSVAGGVVGYFLGYWFWDATQSFFLTYVFPKAAFSEVMGLFKDNGFVTIFLAGFTPIPFKVFTIASGVAGLEMLPFLGGAILGRGLRFFIEGGVLYFLGPKFRVYMDTYFERITIGISILIVLIFALFKLLN